MNPLKRICLAIFGRIKQAGLLPGTILEFGRRRRERTALDEREVERLDRIRNPSKYLGK